MTPMKITEDRVMTTWSSGPDNIWHDPLDLTIFDMVLWTRWARKYFFSKFTIFYNISLYNNLLLINYNNYNYHSFLRYGTIDWHDLLVKVISLISLTRKDMHWKLYKTSIIWDSLKSRLLNIFVYMQELMCRIWSNTSFQSDFRMINLTWHELYILEQYFI